MSNEFDLQSALDALDEYGYDKKHSTDLEQARTKVQMEKYIHSLDFSLKRLQILQQVVNEAVDNQINQQKQSELVQTYRTKLINLSREWNMSYQDVLALMSK
ncbi:hypothetical protein [Shewanella sp. NIFS-20-20]|uniref:hypothetical protein n=1 Tax=Shewanella sp. NIFS-20-20 TaxID=2853806 RepID=UPI001C43773F|nr:hypothetical protein [Shewanella sp. NIFS-20-20]MBV7315069.1 hypothetical protein [Shewanella sp. NIFS-20-20]